MEGYAFSAPRAKIVGGSVDDDNPRVAPAGLLDQRIEAGRMRGRESHAAMRNGPSELPDVAGAVDCIAAPEEHRIGHWRIIVFPRIPHPHQTYRTVGAPRCAVAPAGS